MRSTTSASPRLPDTPPRQDDRNGTAAEAKVPLPRLYFLRLGYLVIAVGLAVTKWPLLINHDVPWPLFEGVETCMLVALSLVWFLDFDTRHLTADGLERTFALNHLTPFLLTNLLLEKLKQNASARVVTVSSNAQATGRIDFSDLQGERSYSGARAYSQSKLANVLFSYELARKLKGTPVTANALHPGLVSTSFGAEDPATVQKIFIPFLRLFMKSPIRGAATSIHLASAPELEQVTGRYFANSHPKKSSEQSYDRALAVRLWQVSADLVGLSVASHRQLHPRSKEQQL